MSVGSGQIVINKNEIIIVAAALHTTEPDIRKLRKVNLERIGGSTCSWYIITFDR